jgi:hypothetical protein
VHGASVTSTGQVYESTVLLLIAGNREVEKYVCHDSLGAFARSLSLSLSVCFSVRECLLLIIGYM